MSSHFEVVVQKYGGSSVAQPDKIKAVAAFIKESLSDNKRICVVVSAMGNTTNNLIALAHQVSREPKKRELDMLISCGERSSMALLSMALNDLGVAAVSLTGSQSGIITDDEHNGAEIIAIKPQRVLEAFDQFSVVIIAGFQGVSEKKEITTLRRGGSDTTAVAMTAAINATQCEIYTDVEGVLDADPRIVDTAQILSTVSCKSMESMALYGARVLAHDAVRLARTFGVVVRVAKTGDSTNGTTIHVKRFDGPVKPVVALTHLRAIVKIALNDYPDLLNASGYLLCGAYRDGRMIGYISNDISQEMITQDDSEVIAGLALITIHLVKNQVALSVLSVVTKTLDRIAVPITDLLVSGCEIFLVVSDDNLTTTLNALHTDLLLEERLS